MENTQLGVRADVIIITDDEEEFNSTVNIAKGEEEFSTDDEVIGKESDIPIHKCRMCFKVYKNARLLYCHVRRHRKIHKCDQCDSTFSSASNLSDHIRKHLGLRPYKCPSCNKDFPSAAGLRQHARSHQGLQLEFSYSCKLCAKAFTSTTQLDNHLNLAHFDIRTHVCAICNNRFFSSADLRRHEPTHWKTTPLEPKKPKSLEEGSQLEHHSSACTVQLIHTCDLCETPFETLSELNDHILEHSTQWQYKCEPCDLNFKNSAELDLHLNTIHLPGRQPTIKSPYLGQCPICDKDIKGEEAQHLLPNGRKVVHTCNLCQEVFEFPCALEKHLKTHFAESSALNLPHREMISVPEIEDDELAAFAVSDVDTQYKPAKAITNAKDEKNKYIASFKKFIADEVQSSNELWKEQCRKRRVLSKQTENIQDCVDQGDNLQQVQVKEEMCEDNEELEFISIRKNDA